MRDGVFVGAGQSRSILMHLHTRVPCQLTLGQLLLPLRTSLWVGHLGVGRVLPALLLLEG